MSHLDQFAGDFFHDVKQRGRDYFRRKLVRITEASDAALTATVNGTSRYHVEIAVDPAEGADYVCTCPYFQDHGDPCKHCWATLLQAQADGMLPGQVASGTVIRPLAVEPPQAADEEDDDNDEEEVEDDEEPAESEGPRPPTRRGGRSVMGFGGRPFDAGRRTHGKPDRKRDDTAWKQQLQNLTRQMRAHPTQVTPPLAWPAGRRIVYIIDRAGALDEAGLSIELAHETPKKDGRLDRPKRLKIERDQVVSLPDPDDRQILQMLMGASRGDYGYYGYYESEAPRQFTLAQPDFGTTLRQICQTGRCRLRRHPNDDQPIPLAWDDGPAWEFWLEVRPSPGGRYLLLDGTLRRPAMVQSPAAEPQILSEPDVTDEGSVPDNGEAISHEADRNDDNGLPADPQEAPDDAATQLVPSSDQRMPIAEPDLLTGGGLVIAHGKIARLAHFDAFDLILALRDGLKLSVPLDQGDELLKTLFALPRLPRLDLPEGLKLEEFRPEPRPRLTIKKGGRSTYDDRLAGTLTFDYGGHIIDEADDNNALLASKTRQVIYRDTHLEARYLARLIQLGFRDGWDYGYGSSPSRKSLRLTPSKLPRVVAELTREGWHVEAEGKLYRQPGEFKLQVRSGIDWFELHGEVSFGDVSAPLPRLLAALRKGENVVRLDDGTFGLLPQEWLKKYGGLAGVGEESDDHLRFNKRQVGFLDALLSTMPQATCDETFGRARDELMHFGGIEPLNEPDGFQGELRSYQRDGLGWMSFLRRFTFGGCLADDMGLGKTVQVLALLEERRVLRANGNASGGSPNSTAPPLHHSTASPTGPSLVVAPRSLVFNWKQEAARFCPNLRVLDHTSVAREEGAAHFDQYDLILTTYGTLRRDMAFMKDVKFDYAVLDEAQAIKNASSESAKAARLIRAEHRLALSGTPVQNHLGDLWSLFEFLNPGMMGSAGIFRELTGSVAGADREAREMLARALRPFILRRTKEQVAKDLPEKLEQTVFCELEAEQRKLYNELRDHYRTSLLERIAKEGMNKAKIQVLEALLRLRQAACHPGLIDKANSKQGSAKLDALLEHIEDILDEGHKVLVFSQFTSFLAIVRQRLDAAKTTYEYLDGKTRDRQQRVERFQNDPDCKLFLISLKAGGLGLNLTAAEYVFLLDPWWNPAVEAQAIDRAHRIGQTRRVFAYRLIAKDTVEEKVLQLQQSKKDLADAIINADNSLIRTLKRDDLELLLS